MDYKAIGLKVGIEIHQQLDTREKLFCHCGTRIRDTAEHSGQFFRYLRATQSEMGEIDRAAQEEMKSDRKFIYYTYDSTCLVENDEEPPTPMNPEALEVCLTIAKMFEMTPVPQVNTMRKLVIDGSNTSGFQRTALVAMSGTLPNGGFIETICLEEEAAQRAGDDIFSLDRLGIPLVEITTSPCMHTPDEVQQVAEYLGMVLRSTGRVKRGLGTIRQDINISIGGGARVEIKGVQELDLISEVVRREVARQQVLLAIKEELAARGAHPVLGNQDVTELLKETGSGVLKKAKVILALKLAGYAGLVGKEIQPGRRLGSEMSDYAKKCGVGGIFHTDELPAYGITAEEVATVRSAMQAADSDCIILVSGTSKKQAECAAAQVLLRAKMALKGVPEETRKMLEEGSTAYMRPLPGAARMYPETDILPVMIDAARWEKIAIPKLLTERAKQFVTEFGLDEALARQMAFSERLPIFESAVAEGIKPTLAVRTLLATLKELQRDGTDISGIPENDIIGVMKAVEAGSAAKEAIPGILKTIARGTQIDAAISQQAPAMSRSDLEQIVRKILEERKEFVSQKGMAALGPLMGIVMAEARGSIDGKLVSEVLKTELGKVIPKI
ncbi:MAG: Glu-tRNA(Gln) amidotransferase subunit GatE [Methanoregulaceae archaeon]